MAQRVAKKVILAMILLLGSWATASAELRSAPLLRPQEVPLSAELRALSPGRVERAESIDFTGDGAPDFIVSVALEPDEEVPHKERL